ncbi:ATP-binding protein [Actinomadura xylanilytica]|uniref:ATP-binding protein n=1 Tax=Actinomadura xylanilytica TaxID=887459 RepID=UPI00255AC8CB|nr:ATP-binding protein [Actinomadura xylanilytica]MDL4774848.1 ATP-binding protein [Actinomadura xylanilytica]
MCEPATIVIKAHSQAVKQVRDFVGLVFGGWGLDDHVARVVVSELATNSIKHGSGEGDSVIVRAYRLDGLPVLEAWDRSDALPVVREPGPAAESGRGLLLMETLVLRWGTRPLAEGGKVVYAVLDPVAV